jgi:hypothetical protein
MVGDVLDFERRWEGGCVLAIVVARSARRSPKAAFREETVRSVGQQLDVDAVRL